MLTRFKRAAKNTLSVIYNSFRWLAYGIYRFPANLSNAITSFFYEYGMLLSEKFALMRNRYPAYRITENGIERKFFSFSEKSDLPFDRDMYHTCQIFIGKWANPVRIDLSEFSDEYSEFDAGDTLDAKHIIPSQKYKTFMKQSVLTEAFTRKTELGDSQKYIMYASLAVNVIILIIIAVGAV